MSKAFYLSDLKHSGEYQLRYCAATIEIYNYAGKQHAKLVSYSTSVIWVAFCNGYIEYMRAQPYRSMTTWAHVRKFLSMFKNGTDAYTAYKKAAKRVGVSIFEF